MPGVKKSLEIFRLAIFVLKQRIFRRLHTAYQWSEKYKIWKSVSSWPILIRNMNFFLKIWFFFFKCRGLVPLCYCMTQHSISPFKRVRERKKAGWFTGPVVSGFGSVRFWVSALVLVRVLVTYGFQKPSCRPTLSLSTISNLCSTWCFLNYSLATTDNRQCTKTVIQFQLLHTTSHYT